MSSHVVTPVDLRKSVERWVSDGVISADQGEQILAAENVPAEDAGGQTHPMVSTSLVTEALAYVGGVIILAAVGWITAENWSSMTANARIALTGSVAVLLLGAGMAVPLRLGDVASRFRSVLWLLSAGAFAGFMAVLATEQFDWSEEDVALFVSASALTYAALLWWRHGEPLQQVAVFIGFIATAATLTTQLPHGPDELPGVAVCGVGLVWLALAWGEVLSYPRLGMLMGVVAAIFGAMTTVSYDWGNVLAISVLVLVVVSAVLVRSLPLLAVSAVGSLLTLPQMMNRYFEGSVAAPLVMVAVGLVMVGGAIYTARRKKEARPTASRHIPFSSRTAGLMGAALVALGFAVAIVAIGV